MHISQVEIKNFRLLEDVKLSFERSSTVIVGRNNSGKTSLTEIFRRLLSGTSSGFRLEDFSIASVNGFVDALKLRVEGRDDDDIRKAIPSIELKLTIQYDAKAKDLGPLTDFIIDLSTASMDVQILMRYELQDGRIDDLFDGFTEVSEDGVTKLFKELRKRIPMYFARGLYAVDPTDDDNVLSVPFSRFEALVAAGFINAQRGLDDVTHTEKDVLGKVLGKLFKTANAESAPDDLKAQSAALDVVIKEMQEKVDNDFNKNVSQLLPALNLFGYPGLSDPNITTETTLDVQNMLDSHTVIKYGKGNGIFLPETYNGLGSRNLIYILFQLFEFFRDFQTRATSPGVCLVFIEEPEAHLHPQMQEVFIRQLQHISSEFAKLLNNGAPWPVQFVVSTHSTHIANAASFDSIRYFLTSKDMPVRTRIKDLKREFCSSASREDVEFLHKYLTLTKCDLFFADKAVLIEGPTERILMPKFIEKTDGQLTGGDKLSSQYVSVIEVGGAYMHHFFKFLDFLELRAVYITDLDATHKPAGEKRYSACPVSQGTHTSNAGTKSWFDPTATGYYLLRDVIGRPDKDKVRGSQRICYQIPETGKTYCGRSLEDAFILANLALFNIDPMTVADVAKAAYEAASDLEKTTFAMEYAIEKTTWEIPLYIKEGLLWLASDLQKPKAAATRVKKQK